jgi:6-phosphogluconate dehydrogenase
MDRKEFKLGLIGLGEMGKNLALNIGDHGFPVAVYNRTYAKTKQFMEDEVKGQAIQAVASLEELVKLMPRPRMVLLVVSSGPAIDNLIEELLPFLEPDDLIIDGGNTFFRDTDRRERTTAEKGVLYLGMGVSGGGFGARFGPSLMPGGSSKAYERVRPILEAISAKVDGDPCVTHLGPGSAGHYVKMVHNGIEYGLMQLIAEVYHLLKLGLGLNNDELHKVFSRWNQNKLNGYLMEITSRIFLKKDDQSSNRLIDQILDQAGQKGTGLWTSINALELQVPIPNIVLAEMMRDLSGQTEERQGINQIFHKSDRYLSKDREKVTAHLEQALYCGMILTFSQGLALLREASRTYKYDLVLQEVARIWRGGCIIRSALLEDIRSAYKKQPDLVHLLMDPNLAEKVRSSQKALRSAIKTAMGLNIPTPGLAASLAYFDSFCSPRLPTNLIQAQRDYFGAHTYQRIDRPGFFHGQWNRE